MKVWGDVLGVKAEFRQVPEEAFWEGVPEVLRELQVGWDYVNDFGHTGGDPSVLRPEEVSFLLCVVLE